MKHCYANETLWVRAAHGDLRQLFVYEEPLNGDAAHAGGECRRWARDDAGRWYSFSGFGDALIESSSGDWFDIVGAPAPALPARKSPCRPAVAGCSARRSVMH